MLAASHRTDNQIVVSSSRNKKETNLLFGWLRKKLDQRKLRKENLKELRSDDWYYQHSWFEKAYFIDKLKRKLMNFTYKLYKKSLETYFFEMIFYVNQLPNGKLEEFNNDCSSTHLGNLRCYLPIILKVNNISQAQKLVFLITKQLVGNNFAIITNYGVEIKKLSPKEEALKIKELEMRFRMPEKQKGVLEITTDSVRLLNPTEPNPRIDELSIKIIDVCKLDWPFDNRFIIALEKYSTQE